MASFPIIRNTWTLTLTNDLRQAISAHSTRCPFAQGDTLISCNLQGRLTLVSAGISKYWLVLQVEIIKIWNSCYLITKQRGSWLSLKFQILVTRYSNICDVSRGRWMEYFAAGCIIATGFESIKAFSTFFILHNIYIHACLKGLRSIYLAASGISRCRAKWYGKQRMIFAAAPPLNTPPRKKNALQALLELRKKPDLIYGWWGVNKNNKKYKYK